MEKIIKTTQYSQEDLFFRSNLDLPKSSGSYFFDSDNLFIDARLKSVEIKNFKSIKHQKIEMKDLTLITGYNSSGKSTISQFITMVIQWLSGLNASSEIDINGPLISLGTFSEIINRNAKNESLTISLEFECKGENLTSFTKILTIEFTNADLERNDDSSDLKTFMNQYLKNAPLDSRYYLKVKSFEKKIIITSSNFAAIKEQNILGEVPHWKKDLGIFINKIIESKFTSSQIKNHNNSSVYNREDVSSIEISYLYKNHGDKNQNRKDTNNIYERTNFGRNFTNFLDDFNEGGDFPFTLTSLESNINIFINENTNPVDYFYMYQLFPLARGGSQQNTSLLSENSILTENSNALSGSVIVSGKSLLKWRLFNELKLVFQGSNNEIPELIFLNSLFEPGLLLKQQPLDSNQKKQLNKFIKNYINIKSIQFLDFDYLEKFEAAIEDINSDIYENFLNDVNIYLEEKKEFASLQFTQHRLYDKSSHYSFENVLKPIETDPLPDDILELREELAVLNNDIEKLLLRKKKCSHKGVHLIDSELKELKRLRRNLKQKINRREEEYKKEFPLQKKSSLNLHNSVLKQQQQLQEQDKNFILEIFKESINIDSGKEKLPFSFIESNSNFSKQMRKYLNVNKRFINKPAFNIQDLIDGNFQEGLSYINKSLTNNKDFKNKKEDRSLSLKYNADQKRLKIVENEIIRIEQELTKLFGQNLVTLSTEHHNPKSKTEKFTYESLLEAKQARGNLEQKSGNNYSIYQCQKCYSWHLTNEFLDIEDNKRKEKEKLKEKYLQQYENAKQDLEYFKRQLEDKKDYSNSEFLEYDLAENIYSWTSKVLSDKVFDAESEKKINVYSKTKIKSKRIAEFNLLFNDSFEKSSKVLPQIIKLVEDETERMWESFNLQYSNTEPDEEFSFLFEHELTESLKKIFKNIVKSLHADNGKDTFLTWASIKALNLLINSESADSYNNYLYFLTRKEINSENKFKNTIEKLCKNISWRDVKSMFNDNDLVVAPYKYNFNEFIFTNHLLEDIQILRLKRPDNYETNKTATKHTPVGITGDMTTSLLGTEMPIYDNGNALLDEDNNLYFFKHYEDNEDFQGTQNQKKVLSYVVSQWISYIFNTTTYIETIRETKSETAVKLNDDFLHNVGSGISQVLPVITSVLLSPGKTIFLEEIEQNLHASAQARLLDLLIVHSIEYGTKIIIETHSDHLINRLRLRKAQLSKVSNKREFDWFVYFAELDNSKNTIFRNLLLNSDGMFATENIPKGFFDQPQIDILNLLNINSKDI